MECMKSQIVMAWATLLIAPGLLREAKLVASYPASNVGSHTQTERTIELTYNCHFDSALSVLDEMIQRDPKSLELKFFRAIVIWRRIVVNGKDAKSEEVFEREMVTLAHIGEERLSKDEQDTIALFYTGGACGYLARYYAATDQLFEAISWGKRGLSYHEELLSLAPRWFDAYLSLGLFHFYASGAPWYLKPILFLLGRNGSEEKAIKFLTLVSEKGKLARFEAEETLAELYVRRGEHRNADSLYRDLAARFPRNLSYYQKSAVSLFELGRYEQAIEICKKGINQLDNPTLTVSSLDSFRIGFLFILMAESYVKLNQLESALRAYKAFLEGGVGTQFFSFAYLSSGRIYEKLHERQQAAECYWKVITINRVPEHVKEARQRVNQLSRAQ